LMKKAVAAGKRQSQAGLVDGPPLAVPMDDDALLHEISAERQSNIDFADVVEISCKKYKEITGATLFIDTYTMIFIRAKKVLVGFHFLEIDKIETASPREMTIYFKDDHPEIQVRTHWSHKEGNIDLVIKAILGNWKYCFPFAPKNARPFKLEPPAKWQLYDEIVDEDVGPCLGYLHGYMSICYYYSTEPKKEIIDHIKVLSAHGLKTLNLFEFTHATEEDLASLVHALQYNTYFTTLTASGNTLTSDILSLIISVILVNTQLKELFIPGVGLTTSYIKELATKINEKQGLLSLASIDFSDNAIEDKGLEYLSDVLSNLNYGPVNLSLSNVSGKQKGMSSLCSALRKNPHVLVTLTSLDLSMNKFDQETSTIFSSWIATPNALTGLQLSGTLINLDKLSDALLRGSVTNLCSLDLSNNKIKNLDKFALFVKSSHALQSLNLSDNPLQLESLLNLVRNIIINYSVLDFELRLVNVGLDSTYAETLMGLLSHNIKFIDISSNQLGLAGLEAIGNGLSANDCLQTLIVNYCFQSSKKEEGAAAETFGQFLKKSIHLKTLEMKADESSALRSEILPIVEALTSNDTLTSLDISGHQGGDLLATAIGRLLQINNTLKSLEIDDNAITMVGFQRVRDGLMRNGSLQQMTMPVFDAMSLKKKHRTTNVGSVKGGVAAFGSTSSANLSTIIKEMETKLSQNYSRPKSIALTKASTQEENIKYKFINAARQKELDLLVHRILATGKNASQDQKNVFSDVSTQSSALAQLQAKQEDIISKLQSDISKQMTTFTKNVHQIVSQTNAAFKEETLKYIFDNYHGLPDDAKENLARIWNDGVPETSEAEVNAIMSKVATEICVQENEMMVESVKKTSNFLYDTLAQYLQSALKEVLKDSIRKELSADNDSGSIGK